MSHGDKALKDTFPESVIPFRKLDSQQLVNRSLVSRGRRLRRERGRDDGRKGHSVGQESCNSLRHIDSDQLLTVVQQERRDGAQGTFTSMHYECPVQL